MVLRNGYGQLVWLGLPVWDCFEMSVELSDIFNVVSLESSKQFDDYDDDDGDDDDEDDDDDDDDDDLISPIHLCSNIDLKTLGHMQSAFLLIYFSQQSRQTP
ncbi:hypothetical protein DPMN_089518 [Dreissena polymorpha]|uniref:Uncharacterized protein n=1 Tax=Dreissena polymorpha TaxID=45954 RepID=A0A9D4QXE1_DREPO|nr:hypothetical protein DPMN_089518 [Dreissena polymorpha]